MKKSRVKMWGEYLALRAFAAIVGAMPISWGMRLAGMLGVLAFRLDRRHREVAYGNLRRAYGESLSQEEIKGITLRHYIHLVRCAVDLIHLPRLLGSGKLSAYVKSRDMHVVDEAIGKGKGGIFVTGHVGNWELLGWVFGVWGYPLHSLARPLDNPLLDGYLRRLREMTGQKIVDRRGGLRRLMRVLRDGGYVAFLIDQDARGEGVFVDFFGRKASTTPAVATLALRTGAPIIIGWARRISEGMDYEVGVMPTIWAEPTGERQGDIERVTAEVTSKLESLVRRSPEQWLWLHRRWKTRPPAEEKGFEEARRETGASSER